MMNIDEIVAKAIKKPTFQEAITFACIWETERAIDQAKRNDFEGWETCFAFVIGKVMDKWQLETDRKSDALLHTMSVMRNRAAMIVSDYEEAKQ